MPPFFESVKGEVLESLRYVALPSERRSNSTLEIFRIRRIDNLAKLTIQDGLATGIERTGNHGHSARHRLQIYDSKPLAPAGHHKSIGQSKVIHFLALIHISRENHAVGEPKSARFFFEPRSVIPITRNQIGQIRVGFQEIGKHLQNLIKSFVSLLRGHSTKGKEDATVLKSISLEQIDTLVAGSVGRGIDAIGNYDASMGIQSRPLRKTLTREVTYDNKMVNMSYESVSDLAAGRRPGINAMDDQKQRNAPALCCDKGEGQEINMAAYHAIVIGRSHLF